MARHWNLYFGFGTGEPAVTGNVNAYVSGNSCTASVGYVETPELSAPIHLEEAGGYAFYAYYNTDIDVAVPTDPGAEEDAREGDILIASAFNTASGADPDISRPLLPPEGYGWTAIGPSTMVTSLGGIVSRYRLWWKRYTSSEPSYYRWTQANVGPAEIVILVFRDAVAGGTPVATYSTNSGTGDLATALSVTTTGQNNLLVISSHTFTDLTKSSPLGWDTFYTYYYTIISGNEQVSVGASGDRAFVPGSSASESWQNWMIAIKPLGADETTDASSNLTGQSMTAAVGTVTVTAVRFVSTSVTGVSATASVGTVTATGKRNVSSSVSGQSVTASVGTVTVGSTLAVTVTLTGVSAAVTVGGVSVSASGAISTSLSGQSVTASVGSVTVSSIQHASTSVPGFEMLAGVGAVTVSSVQAGTANVTGNPSIVSAGTATVAIGIAVFVNGQEVIASVGEAEIGDPIGVSVSVDGQEMTASVGSVTLEYDYRFVISGVSMSILGSRVYSTNWGVVSNDQPEIWREVSR